MDDSLIALRREIGQLFGEKTKLGSPEEEQMIICAYCGAMVRLIGLPPVPEPDEPWMMLYYPIQFCPQCAAGVGRALDIELVAMAPWAMPGAPRWHDIACSRCGSELRYKTQALPPQYLRSLQCPVCENELGVTGLEVETVSAKPWPPVAEEPEEPEIPWKPIVIVGGALTVLFMSIGISHFISKKSRR